MRYKLTYRHPTHTVVDGEVSTRDQICAAIIDTDEVGEFQNESRFQIEARLRERGYLTADDDIRIFPGQLCTLERIKEDEA